MIACREHGTAGPAVVVLHGGPGAPGSAQGLAEGLADSFRVFEPFQRQSGGRPLTVAGHVQDLKELLDARCGHDKPALVGHSWGAMLALAFAAEHPSVVSSIALLGCGTFDTASRQQLEKTREERLTDELRRRIARVAEQEDAGRRLASIGLLYMTDIDSLDLAESPGTLSCDAQGFDETWADMLRLQAEGLYPKVFRNISEPVLLAHGDYDPHPGRMIFEHLNAYIPGPFEYRELTDCGHYPWLEKRGRAQIFDVLTPWIRRFCDIESGLN